MPRKATYRTSCWAFIRRFGYQNTAFLFRHEEIVIRLDSDVGVKLDTLCSQLKKSARYLYYCREAMDKVIPIPGY